MTPQRPVPAISRRGALAALGGSVAGAAVAGCQRADAEGSRGPIVFADGTDTSRDGQIRQLVDRWNDRRLADERVQLVELGTRTDSHRAQLAARAQEMAEPGARPDRCLDVITIDVIWVAQFARGGHVVPLGERRPTGSRMLAAAMDAVTLDGLVWALPQRTDAPLLFYRTDILAAEGSAPPRTWPELARQAEEFGRRHRRDGYVTQLARYEGFTVNALEAVWRHSPRTLTGTHPRVTDPAAVEAGLGDLVDGLSRGWIARASLGHDEQTSLRHFQRGGAVFMRNWPFAYQRLAETDSPVRGRFGVAATPGPGALGGWSIALSGCARHRRTARAFMRFLVGPDSQRTLLVEAGLAPTRTELYDDAGLRARIPYLTALRESVEHSLTRPRTPYYDQVTLLIQQHLRQTLTRPESVAAAVQRLTEELEPALQGR